MALYTYDADGNRTQAPRPTRTLGTVPAVGVIGRYAHAGTKGVALEVGVGCEVWSRERKTADLEAQGGVVLECHAGASGRDDEGEIFERPAWYTVWDRQLVGAHIRQITESELDLSATRPASNLGLIIREMAGELAVHKQARGKRKRGSALLSSYELNLCRWVGALGKVLAAGLLSSVEVTRPSVRNEDEEEW